MANLGFNVWLLWHKFVQSAMNFFYFHFLNFYFIIFNWSIIYSQYYVSSRCASWWFDVSLHYKMITTISLSQFCHSVVSNSLRPHESQHTRPPSPSPTPRVHTNSCPSSRWCHPAISSSVVPFSSCGLVGGDKIDFTCREDASLHPHFCSWIQRAVLGETWLC